MEGTIKKICDNMVYACTEAGNIIGCWCSQEPAKLKKYFFELDSDDIVTCDVIKLSEKCISKMSCLDGFVILNGYVEDVQDEVLFLRVLSDLLMLNVDKTEGMKHFIGKYVTIKLCSLKIYDTGLC